MLGRKGVVINKGIIILHLLNTNSDPVSADSEVSLIFLIGSLIAPFLNLSLIGPFLNQSLIGPILNHDLITHL